MKAPKISRKDQQEREERMKTVAGEGKKARNFAPPHPSGPHPLGPPPFRGHARIWPNRIRPKPHLAKKIRIWPGHFRDRIWPNPMRRPHESLVLPFAEQVMWKDPTLQPAKKKKQPGLWFVGEITDKQRSPHWHESSVRWHARFDVCRRQNARIQIWWWI